MANMRDNDPPEHRFDDHSVIVPPHKLRAVIKHTREPGGVAMDVVAHAEAALAEIRGEFNGWMEAECTRIEKARLAIHDNGLDYMTADTLFRPAHDIKGTAATLGFPLAGRLASSLCRLLTHAPDFSRVPQALIDHFVNSIRAIVREEIHEVHNPVATEIAENLSILVETFLANELKDGYAEIAVDAAPRLEVADAAT